MIKLETEADKLLLRVYKALQSRHDTIWEDEEQTILFEIDETIAEYLFKDEEEENGYENIK